MCHLSSPNGLVCSQGLGLYYHLHTLGASNSHLRGHVGKALLGPEHPQLCEDLHWWGSPLGACLFFFKFTNTSTQVKLNSTWYPLDWWVAPLAKTTGVCINLTQLWTEALISSSQPSWRQQLASLRVGRMVSEAPGGQHIGSCHPRCCWRDWSGCYSPGIREASIKHGLSSFIWLSTPPPACLCPCCRVLRPTCCHRDVLPELCLGHQ